MPPCLFRRYYTTVQRITQALQNKNTAKTQAYHSSSCRSPLYSKTKTPLSGVFWSYRTDFSRATCCSAERAARTPRANASITICRRHIIRHHAGRRYTLKTKTPLSGVFWSYWPDFSRATCCSAERAARTPRANASITICRRRIIRHHADRRYTLKQKHRSAVFSGATGRT